MAEYKYLNGVHALVADYLRDDLEANPLELITSILTGRASINIEQRSKDTLAGFFLAVGLLKGDPKLAEYIYDEHMQFLTKAGQKDFRRDLKKAIKAFHKGLESNTDTAPKRDTITVREILTCMKNIPENHWSDCYRSYYDAVLQDENPAKEYAISSIEGSFNVIGADDTKPWRTKDGNVISLAIIDLDTEVNGFDHFCFAFEHPE